MNFLELLRNDTDVINYSKDKIRNLEQRAKLIGAARMLLVISDHSNISVEKLAIALNADDVLQALKLERKTDGNLPNL